MGTMGTEAAAPCSMAPWAPWCCCGARLQQGGRLSGAGAGLSWERILHRGWPSPMPAWPTRATTAATTLAPARPGPLSACSWAVSDPGPTVAPAAGWGSPGGTSSGVMAVPCPRSPCTACRRVLGHQLPAGSELLLGPGPRATAGNPLCGHVQMFSLTPYVVNVTAMNPLGSASRLLPFLLENIIKPDPPEDLRVSPIPGETKKLLVEWSPPGSWPFPQYFPLKYRIRYAQEGGSVTKTIGPYEQTSYTLTGVPPRTLHHIQVAAKDFTDSGEFSAWSLPASGMPWVEP
ncbi:interleukin-27 subunit beta isoform X1 [Falco rusticolus]|uniref:interleukin-27 subunit beta isoform X1 n=1 Tax=Falco rusticolus TaxID=120794 RepID=UPI0018866E6F|nr:interleukin-27 subunit beta isoform X1 [Falco rusticolus]XP_037239536.1 interleukin-27 subunit beta isoform X1 [Falco rusticolus]